MLVERMERMRSRTVGTPPSSPGEQSPLQEGGLDLGPELGWGRRVIAGRGRWLGRLKMEAEARFDGPEIHSST